MNKIDDYEFFYKNYKNMMLLFVIKQEYNIQEQFKIVLLEQEYDVVI